MLCFYGLHQLDLSSGPAVYSSRCRGQDGGLFWRPGNAPRVGRLGVRWRYHRVCSKGRGAERRRHDFTLGNFVAGIYPRSHMAAGAFLDAGGVEPRRQEGTTTSLAAASASIESCHLYTQRRMPMLEPLPLLWFEPDTQHGHFLVFLERMA